jgi:AcrR family transcriptional regulator
MCQPDPPGDFSPPAESPGDGGAIDRGGESGVRKRLLDAAEGCYRRFGIGKTTVDDVARAASLSRATVYRHFKNKDELLLGLVSREGFRLSTDVEKYLHRFDDIGSWIVEGLLFSLREIPKRPVLAMLFDAEAVGTASRLLLSSPDLVEIGGTVLERMFEPAQRQGVLRESLHKDVLLEWVLRILTSYLTVPSRLATTEDELRTLFRTMILPAVIEMPMAPAQSAQHAHAPSRRTAGKRR